VDRCHRQVPPGLSNGIVTMIDRPRILILSQDEISANMSGPAIRCWEFARVLSHHGRVTLANPGEVELDLPPGVDTLPLNTPMLQERASDYDVIILSGYILAVYPFLKTLDVPLVVDIYAPFNLENLQRIADKKMAFQLQDHDEVLTVLTDQLRCGDFFLCASEAQRDYWLGVLSGLNRVNPLTHGDDPTLRRLIEVVPFGLPADSPRQTCQVLKGVHPGISASDKVVLWGGGIYDWLDPLTLIRAMNVIVAQRDDVKLFFMGVKHPNPTVRGFEMLEQAIGLSRELGLENRFVFFNDWVPYKERANYLLEADIGASLHLDHLETRYAFRTRLLDYIWAGLPVVCTSGDTMAKLVSEYRLGQVVAYQAVAEVASAILELLDTPNLRAAYASRFEATAPMFSWPNAARPLVDFCQAPYFAADRTLRATSVDGKAISEIPAWQRYLRKGYRYLSTGEVGTLWEELKRYLAWRLKHD
jgi:glycosyltransferase involved in cell wall biosynthesis